MSLQNYGLQEREEKKSILLTKLLFGEVGGYLSLFFSGLVNENGCRRCIFLVQRPCPVEYQCAGHYNVDRTWRNLGLAKLVQLTVSFQMCNDKKAAAASQFFFSVLFCSHFSFLVAFVIT
jgi:hypothetical protein